LTAWSASFQSIRSVSARPTVASPTVDRRAVRGWFTAGAALVEGAIAALAGTVDGGATDVGGAIGAVVVDDDGAAVVVVVLAAAATVST